MKYLSSYFKALKITIVLLLLGLASQVTMAQYSFCAFGDNVKNNQGEMSFTAGQCFYAYHSSSQLLIIEGVQQPYEIQKATNFKDVDIEQNILVYPNPVQNVLTVDYRTEDNMFEDAIVRLFSIEGIEVSVIPITSSHTVINTSDLRSGMYLLKIYHSKHEHKAIKIIKK